jgi:CRISPR-associated endonuclease Csn1
VGVRIFDKAEMPKDGSSVAAKRREKRSLRRVIRRRSHRIERTKLLIANTLISKSQLNDLHSDCKNDVYELRYKALNEKLTNLELSKVLLHLIKRRGFKSNRKSELTNKDVGKLLSGVEENQKIMQQKGYKTIGEMIFKDTKYFEVDEEGKKVYKTRNKQEDYSKTFYRIDIEQEIKTIFDAQRKLGNDKASSNLEELYLKIFNSQRSFDSGPGEPSPYRGVFDIGYCTYEKEEKRASKHSFTFDYFDALTRINNLKIRSSEGVRVLEKEEKQEVIAFIKNNEKLTYKKLRSILKMNGTQKEFSYLKYDKSDESNKIEDKTFINMSKSFKIRKALFEDAKKLKLTKDIIKTTDEVATILSMYKEDEKRKEQLNLAIKEKTIPLLLTDMQIENLLPLNPKEFGNLSLKAMQNIIPHLEQGLTYDKACKKIGYEHHYSLIDGERQEKIKGQTLIDLLNEVRVPVVRRAISQAIKVINAIVNSYGSPQLINVEVAREVSKTLKERNEINKKNEESKERNEKIYKLLQETFNIAHPSGQDIVKYKLYDNQGGKCAYSQKVIDANIIFTDKTQIDHIIPYSRSLDDSYSNKVLVLASENQHKGNKIPYEYMGSDENKWDKFKAFVEVQIKGRDKKNNLLRKTFTKEDEKEWKEKNLNDAKYISRYILNVLQKHFKFASSVKYDKKAVNAVNGRVTSYLRKIWGLNKVREDGDLHHALDATVIAMATDSSIQKITNYLKYEKEVYSNQAKEDEQYAFVEGNIIDKSTGEVIKQIPRPYEHFTKELILRLYMPQKDNEQYEYNMQELIKLGYTGEQLEKVKPVFVSRMPRRGMKGSIHDDTIRSAKFIEKNKTVIKTELTKLKFNKETLEIVGYPEQFKKDDRLLYSALVKRLHEFDGDANLAFKDEFKKPKRDGSDGPTVKKVKIEETNNSFVKLDKMNGVANKSSMIRIDVFEKDNKNYLVPVYISDFYIGITPNKAISSGKDWLEMTNDYNFKFSLYPKDLIYVENSKEIKLTSTHKENKGSIVKKNFMLYYIGADISVATIGVINHDNSFEGRISPRSFVKLEKYAVDILGNYYKVKNEKRQMLERG